MRQLHFPLMVILAGSLAACSDDGSYGDYGDYGGTGFGGGDECDDDCVETDPERNELPPDELEECKSDEDVVLYLSPDDSNSMSSPVQVREAALSTGAPISSIAVRPWEFLNYYSFGYPPADPGQLDLHFDLREREEGGYALLVAVASEARNAEFRESINVTLVLDESGSMSGEPIERLRDTARAIAGSLREGDVISLVSWSTQNNTRLASHLVSGPDDPTLLAAIDAIEVGGATDLHGGLSRGYELAQANFDSERINRVVLISDGGANVGVTSADLIGAMAGSEDQEGIYLVGVGVGTGASYNDALMDVVTDIGKGASVFVPTTAEAETIFGERFLETMDVAARDVRVRLELPPGFEIVRFSGEEYSEDPKEIEPQHLAPNDVMVFYQELETCAPELIGPETPVTVWVSWKDPITFETHEVGLERSFGELLDQSDPMLGKAGAILSYAEAVTGGDRSAAMADLAVAESLLPGDGDLAEIRQVLETL